MLMVAEISNHSYLWTDDVIMMQYVLLYGVALNMAINHEALSTMTQAHVIDECHYM